MEKELVYIATPYSATKGFIDAIKFLRFRNVTKFAAELMKRGLHVYSPITHCHMLAMAAELPGDWEFWRGLDRKFLDACTAMIVYQQPGWEESTGVKGEIATYSSQEKPILFVPPEMGIDDVVELIQQVLRFAQTQVADKKKVGL